MASASSQPNVYDEKGTILYRVVPQRDAMGPVDGGAASASEQSGTPRAPGAAAAGAPLAPGRMRDGAKAQLSKTVSNISLSATQNSKNMNSNKLAHGKTTATTTAMATTTTAGPQGSMGVEQALAMLFPPEPLESPQSQSVVPGTWVKVAAVDHTGRMDAVHLQDHLQRRCRDEHARPSGVLCTIREGIYTDGLREVLRQTTVLCPERGLLLAELAAAMQQTTNTYDILFDNACQYAVRKGIERDLQSSLFDDKERLESEVRRLENRVNELRAKHDGMQKRFEEQRDAEKNMHEEEVKYIKKANLQIVNEIKRLTALEKLNAAAAAAAAAAQAAGHGLS